MLRTFGWIPDPTDPRDQDAVPLLFSRGTNIPVAASNHDLVKVIDQGALGSCTVNAVAQALRAAELREYIELANAQGIDPVLTLIEAQKSTPFMSRLFGYFLARAWEGTTKEDAGTYIRLVFQSINKYGFPPESAWPYSDNTDSSEGPVLFDRMPNADAFRQAYDQRDSVENETDNLISYSRISVTGQARIDAIKLAVSQRYLVAFGTQVSEKFCSDMSANGGKPIDPPIGMKLAGGHAMCIGGYNADGAKIINSWSEQFGQNGWCMFTWDYLAWNESNDFWIVKRAPILQKAA